MEFTEKVVLCSDGYHCQSITYLKYNFATRPDTFNVVFENLSTGNSLCCPKIEVKPNTEVHDAFVCSRMV